MNLVNVDILLVVIFAY